MLKRILSIALMLMIGVSIIGCNNNKTKNEDISTDIEKSINSEKELLKLTDLIGKSPDEILNAKLGGTKEFAEIDNEKILVSIVYEEKILDEDSELAVTMEEDKSIGINILFKENNKDKVLEEIDKQLGKPDNEYKKDNKSLSEKGSQYKAEWNKNGFLYTLILAYDSLGLTIDKELN